MTVNQNPSLNKSHQVAANTVWLMSTTIILLVFAFFAIPIIIEHLGLERFGTLVLILSVIGHFGILDFGFGRAITKIVSAQIAQNQHAEAKMTLLPAIVSLGILGCIVASILALVSPWLTAEILSVPASKTKEAGISFQIAAICLPFVIISNGARGYLEGHQIFKSASKVRIFSGLVNYSGTIVALQFWNRLEAVIIAIAAGRILECFLLIWLCWKKTEVQWRLDPSQFKVIKPLFSFGSWIAVSNVVGPLMVFADRFVIGMVVSVSAVAYYTTAFEIVTKLWIIPGALGATLLPLFSATIISNRKEAVRMFMQTERYLFIIFTIPVFAMVVLASPLLTWWLGSAFSIQSAPILQCLAIGVLVNSIAQIPYIVIQGYGRPDITAKLHIFELPFYIFMLYCLLSELGVIGAAIAWTTRVILDAIILSIVTVKIFPEARGSLKKRFAVLFASIALLFVLSPISYTDFYGIVLMLGVAVIGILTWGWMLEQSERTKIRNWISRLGHLGRSF